MSDCGNSISLILIDSKIVARSLSKTFVVFYIFYIASALLLRIFAHYFPFFFNPEYFSWKNGIFFFSSDFRKQFLGKSQ